MNILSSSIFSSTEVFSLVEFMLAEGVAIILGIISAYVYQYKNVYNKSFVITLALLPAVVTMVIILVNGNLGAGVAVAGAFSLIRFRSAPGGAKEIYAIFLAMAIGLATGMGFILLACVFAAIMNCMSLIMENVSIGEMGSTKRQLIVTIPESLDYEDVFNDIFASLLKNFELTSVQTTDLGSLFKLRYIIELNEEASEKDLIDQIRVRNGNLEVRLNRHITKENEL